MATKIVNASDLLAAPAGQDGKTVVKPKPATRDMVIDLIEGAQQHPALGDIVVWRSAPLQTHLIPALGEPVIVTRVLPAPMRFTPGENDDVPMVSIGVAFVRHCDCGDPECPKANELVELHVDGRRMRKVGSVLN